MKKNIVTSSLILIISGLITRILGFVYRIYMSNIIGSMGMGLYQLVIPIYTLVWSITCSGFNTTISKLTSAEKAKGQYGNIRRFLIQAIAITTGLSLIIALFMFLFAEFIANTIFDEPRITLSIQVLAVAIPFMAVGSSIRGYFYGLQDALIPAISQVLEQVIRLFVVYIVATGFMGMGIEVTIAAMMVGVLAGEFVACIYVFLAYKDYNPNGSKSKRLKSKSRKLKKRSRKLNLSNSESYTSKESLYTLIAMSVPLTLSRTTGSLLSTLENILIPQRLMIFGMTQSEALSEFGKLTGMAMPLIQLPSVVLIALSISLVPAISEALAMKNYSQINNTVAKTMIFSMVVGVGGSAVFITFSDVLGELIYSQDIAFMLVYLGLLSPFLYANSLLTAILNGLGLQLFIFRNSLISSIISISFIYFLVPLIGIYGFISGWFTSLLLLCIINIWKIKRTADIDLDIINWFLKPTLCAFLSVIAIRLIKNWFIETIGVLPATIILIIIMGVIYLCMTILSGSLKLSDLNFFQKKNSVSKNTH